MKRILVVDDDVTICKLVASILEDMYEVSYATELEAAQKMLGEARFDLIIADYFLGAPEINPSGWPLGEACKALAPETPVIALTGLDPSLRSVMRESGARAIVSKPFDLDDLIGTVDHLV